MFLLCRVLCSIVNLVGTAPWCSILLCLCDTKALEMQENKVLVSLGHLVNVAVPQFHGVEIMAALKQMK